MMITGFITDMSPLRPTLFTPPRRNLKDDFGVILICIVIALVLHLLGFLVWQAAGGQKELNYFLFDISQENQTLELTVFIGDNSAEANAQAELEVDKFLGTSTSEDGTGENLKELPPLSEEDMIAIKAAQAIDEDLAKAEILPHVAQPGDSPPETPLVMEKEAPEFKSHSAQIRSEVYKFLIVPPVAKAQFKPSQLVVSFTISNMGELLSIVILKSTGNPTLDHAGMEAIRSAEPFPPFPAELAHYEQRTTTMEFNYEAKAAAPKSQ